MELTLRPIVFLDIIAMFGKFSEEL